MKKTITSKTKASLSEFDYDEYNGYNYLWQLVNLCLLYTSPSPRD